MSDGLYFAACAGFDVSFLTAGVFAFRRDYHFAAVSVTNSNSVHIVIGQRINLHVLDLVKKSAWAALGFIQNISRRTTGYSKAVVSLGMGR